jgi:hypothetical protein
MYLVVNIGCIECGVSSNVVGLFSTEKEAERVRDICVEKYYWREGGENRYRVFELPPVGAIHEEYIAAFTPPPAQAG